MQTWEAHGILDRRAGFLDIGARTRVVLSTRAGVIFGVERAAGARLAHGGDKLFARRALCDCHCFGRFCV